MGEKSGIEKGKAINSLEKENLLNTIFTKERPIAVSNVCGVNTNAIGLHGPYDLAIVDVDDLIWLAIANEHEDQESIQDGYKHNRLKLIETKKKPNQNIIDFDFDPDADPDSDNDEDYENLFEYEDRIRRERFDTLKKEFHLARAKSLIKFKY